MAYNEALIGPFRKLGYIPNQEFLDLCGLSNNGCQSDKLKKLGVRTIEISIGPEKDRTLRLWHKDDCKLVFAKSDEKPIAVAGESNGGKLIHRIKEIEERLSKIEDFVRQF